MHMNVRFAQAHRWTRCSVHLAEEAANQLAELHRRLVTFPVIASTAIRSVDDVEYIAAVYRAGVPLPLTSGTYVPWCPIFG